MKIIGGIACFGLFLYCGMADGLLDKLGPVWFLAVGGVLCGLSLLLGDTHGRA